MDYPVYPDHDEDILTDEPGLMPDILAPLEESSGMLRLSDPARVRPAFAGYAAGCRARYL